ncbi:MAG: ATP-binding protein [Myxococcota bacterium]|jgi:ligand-binding sensor domain-containing protein/two-component sensor histidine kinase|nr:ATP-binding protein [Myxococcota bacterium]
MQRCIYQALSVLAALLLCEHAYGLDPKREFYQYVYRNWSLDQGLPQSSVFAVKQGPDGYLWLATAEGLARFDGVRFQVFDTSNTPALKSNMITTLELDSHGALWLGTRSGGLTRYADGVFETYGKEQGLLSPSVSAILEDARGRLWVGTLGSGLFLREGDLFVSQPKPPERVFEDVYDLLEDSAQRLWVASGDGVYSFTADHGVAQDFEVLRGLSSDKARVVFEDSRGAYWIGTYEGGLNRLSHGFIEHFGEPDGLVAKRFFSIFEDSRGSVWIGSAGKGLYRYQGGKFSVFSTVDGLADDSVRGIFEDKESNLWVGTYGGGVAQLRDGKFTPLNTRAGLSHDYAFAMCEDKGGTVWIGTYGGGLNRWRNGVFSRQPLDTPEPLRIGDLVCSPKGEVWVGTYGSGVYLVRGDESVPFPGREHLPQMNTAALHLDRDNRLYVGSNDAGVFILQGDSVTQVDKGDGLPSNYVRVITQEASGDIWFGTEGGLVRFRDKPLSTFTTANGLLSDLIYSLFPDPDGSLWIGTYGGGLSRLKDNKIKSVAKRHGLFDDVVYTIFDDHLGKLWMTSNRGIFTVERRELEAFFAGQISEVHSKSYGTSDGLKSSECNGGFQPSSCRRKDGSVLFPTLAGVVSIDPSAIALNTQPPPVKIEAVVADDQSHHPDRDLLLAASTRRVEFRYTALSFVASEKVRFKYRLDGFDPDWIEAQDRRVAYYTNLGPGKYRFRVIAANSDGLWNEQGASFSFAKQKHFYETIWFRLLALAALALLISLVFVARVRQIKKRNLELEKLVEERTRKLEIAHQKIVRLEKDTTERQMAGGFAHETRNALTAASLVMRKILYFSTDGRSMSDERGNILIALFKELRGRLSGEEMKSVATKLSDVNQSEKRMTQLMFKANESIERALEVTDQILSYAHIGKQEPGRETVLLSKVVEKIAAEYKDEWASADLSLTLQIPDEVRLVGTEHQYYAIFNNLVLNSAEALKNEPVRADCPKMITVSATPEGQGFRVVVSDTGVGISEADFPRIFEPFFSTNPTSGKGLGLSVVRKYVDLLRGNISIESELHRGTTVTLWFPSFSAW